MLQQYVKTPSLNKAFTSYPLPIITYPNRFYTLQTQKLFYVSFLIYDSPIHAIYFKLIVGS